MMQKLVKFNLKTKNFTARLAQVDLVKKLDFDAKLNNLNKN